MRVLHVNSGNLYGGIETLIATLARFRAACPEMEPSFALCFPGRSAQELAQAGATVHLLGPARVSRPWTIWRVRRELASVLRGSRPDLVVCHSSWNHAIFAPVARRFGSPLAFWAHGPSRGDRWLDRWASWTRPDLVIANSQWTRNGFCLFPGTPIEVVLCPVADCSSKHREDDRRSVRAEIGTGADAVVIVQVSRLEAWKGHALLLDALARLREIDGWECWIVGGPQRPEEERYLADLKAKAERDGIGSRVRFVGQRTDVPRVLAAADIHCQPNLEPEPFGITFVEALYSGLPVVATALGGPKEIIDETCGFTVAAGDVPGLADVLRRLMHEPELRHKLGSSGPARARFLSDPGTQLRSLAAALLGVCSRGDSRFPETSWKT
jgi:glycosyltransferase involved in cell wall biosynthesis